MKNQNTKYQAVIFDLFGTLVDVFSRKEYDATLKEMASILNTPFDGFCKIWSETGPKRGIGFYKKLDDNLSYICREFNVRVTKTQLKKAAEIRLDYVRRALVPRDSTIKILKQLNKHGMKIGLISNCSTEPPLIWPETPFASYFDVAVFSSTSGLMKPDPKIYLLATKKLKTKPDYCLYVGDGDDNELTGAAAVGMHPILIRDVHEERSKAVRTNEQTDNYPCPQITSLKEIPNLVK
jgi:putative hydrolase of the HAD superfamily